MQDKYYRVTLFLLIINQMTTTDKTNRNYGLLRLCIGCQFRTLMLAVVRDSCNLLSFRDSKKKAVMKIRMGTVLIFPPSILKIW